MTAAASQIPVDKSQDEVLDSCQFYKLKANTTIPAGTLAMRVSGNDYAEPYVGNTTGAILLGVAKKTYVNTSGSTEVYPDGKPMVFERGVFAQFVSDGSITADDVMVPVAFKDNQTIGHTVAAHDCTGLLICIDKRASNLSGTTYRVRVSSSGPT